MASEPRVVPVLEEKEDASFRTARRQYVLSTQNSIPSLLAAVRHRDKGPDRRRRRLKRPMAFHSRGTPDISEAADQALQNI